MKPGSSINAAKEAIIRLFQIANTINPYLSSVAHHYSGSFSVVPYGNENLHGLDKFASEADLRTKLDQIQFNTSHSMDGPLALKVFSPANKTNSGSIVTPHLVVIITDGYVSRFPLISL